VDFGRIASVNAISDIYAMGGTPLVAIAVLGWPVNTVPIEAARLVIDGARMACHEAGIALAGGHSIDSPEPIFGLAVTGRVSIEHLKKNSDAQEGDVLFLTKPIGVGIVTTAQKKGLVDMAHLLMARDSMVQLNKVGAVFGRMEFVHSMTDVTGFGLLGHLKELCDGADLGAEIDFDAVPLLERDVILDYVAKGCIPGGTTRNFDSYGHAVNELTAVQRAVLCDPQTSGGLLVTVAPDRVDDFMSVWRDELETPCVPIGRMTKRSVDPVSNEQVGVARTAVITVR
jgi:selenide,water dikinase